MVLRKRNKFVHKKQCTFVVLDPDGVDGDFSAFVDKVEKAMQAMGYKPLAISGAVTVENGKTYSHYDIDWDAGKPKDDAVAYGEQRSTTIKALEHHVNASKQPGAERFKALGIATSPKPARATDEQMGIKPAPTKKPLRRVTKNSSLKKVSGQVEEVAKSGRLSSVDNAAAQSSKEATSTALKKLRRKT